MVQGISVKFVSYEETLPRVLKVIKFQDELKKHSKIVLKPNVRTGLSGSSTSADFIEPILKFCMENKNPGTEIFIAEGADGISTEDAFEGLGYKKLAEKYGVGLIDLNNTEYENIESPKFLRFDSIQYPKILKEAFVLSLPVLKKNEETQLEASLSNMLGAFPSSHYKGLFTKAKTRIRRWDIGYSVHDIIACKMPEFSIIDASENGVILVGKPLEMDRQAAKLVGLNWNDIKHLRMIDDALGENNKKAEELEKS